MKLKNKTQLRKDIIECVGSIGIWDFIEVYSDGSWGTMSQNTSSSSYVDRRSVGSYMSEHNFYQGSKAYRNHRAISDTFKEIEKKLKRVNKELEIQYLESTIKEDIKRIESTIRFMKKSGFSPADIERKENVLENLKERFKENVCC